ncbi:MAG: hypothetical protein ACFFC7_24595 [Candidatus Hermodarchaeota archaeon]
MNTLVHLELAREYRLKRQLSSKNNMRKQQQEKQRHLKRTLSNLETQKSSSACT